MQVSVADRLIAHLGLEPHPEGGFFRETFRSARQVQPDDDRPPRSALTTIVFLLPDGTASRWHQVRSDEVWTLVDGGPLELLIAPASLDRVERVVLGPALETAGPVHVVPAGSWQAAVPLGAHALAVCAVAPGFDFADFTLCTDDRTSERLLRLDPRGALL